MNPHIRQAAREDAPAIVEVLHQALADDPFVEWLIDGRARARRRYVRLMVEEIALARGVVQIATDADRVLGAALWAPPRTFSLSAWETIWLMPRMMSIIGWSRMSATSAKLEEIERARPAEPFWLLTLLGIAPGNRRRGLGSALLRQTLERCDDEAVPVVCETAAPENVEFYRRHGFTVKAERSLAIGGPTSWSLVREPRTPGDATGVA